MAWGTGTDKMFVTVKSKRDKNGWDIPVELTYNEERFEITDPVRSMKLFNNAVRYKCNIDEKAVELYNEGDDWWILT